jgi:hypothetical protein
MPSKLYRVPDQEVDAVPWEGDAEKYDCQLAQLGQGNSEFIIFKHQQFDLNLDLPLDPTDSCVIWMYQGEWLAKYFKHGWQPHWGYRKINVELTWERNPAIPQEILFIDDPFERNPIDLHDLHYELTWYLDPEFTASETRIWIYRTKLSGSHPRGIKDMGNLVPQPWDQLLTWKRNPAIPQEILFIDDPSKHNNNNIDLHDLHYELTWYLDPAFSPSGDRVWIYRTKLSGSQTHGIKDMGDLVPQLPDQLDVVFISYKEPNADENWQRVLEKAPHALQVQGVQGIHNAHRQAAQLVKTDMFYVVDGDAYLEEHWQFDFQPSIFDRDCVHVWHSRNPVNQLEYGYGGVKLLPTTLTADMDIGSTDMTTSISNKFKVMPGISNTTAFNTSEYSAWRSAFRECAKLASDTLPGNSHQTAQQRLNTWCTVGYDQLHGSWAIKGAQAGRAFGQAHQGDQTALVKINDFAWLESLFQQEQSINT